MNATTQPFWLRNQMQSPEMKIDDVRFLSPDFIKVAAVWAYPPDDNSEAFWCKVLFIASSPLDWIDAEIMNELKGTYIHTLKKGDVLRIYARHIIDTEYIPST